MSYLSPEQLTDPYKHTPEPLIHGEGRAGERLSSKLHNYDLQQHHKYEYVKVFNFSMKTMKQNVDVCVFIHIYCILNSTRR